MNRWTAWFAGVLLTVVCVLGCALPSAAQTSPYVPITCENLSPVSIIPVAINEAGEIVGWYASSGEVRGFFIGQRGGCQTIDVPGAASVFPMGINDRGQIVGTYNVAATPAPGSAGDSGFLWDRGVVTTYSVKGAGQTVFLGINNRGQIVGYYDNTPNNAGPDYGFTLEDDVLTPVPNEFSPGSSLSVAGINPQGEMVGNLLNGGTELGFYLDKTGVMKTFSLPGQPVSTMMMGINPQGDMTGMAFLVSDDMTTARAFVRDREGRTLELKPNVSETGVLVGKINASGDMVGAYFLGGAFHGFMVNKRDLK